MITENIITKSVVYFTGIVVSIGLVLENFSIIQVGIIPSAIICLYWAFKWQKSMKLKVFDKSETKSFKSRE